MSTNPSRVVSAEGLVNARDLGGLERTGGGHTPRGVFFRSENLSAVTARGWRHLHALGIRTVLDLRQPAERAQSGYRAPDWLTRVEIDHDGLTEHPDFWAEYWESGLVGTALYYLPHLTRLPHRSAAVLSALARAPEGGVLFHCVSGRDRTGLISLLLLAIAGTTEEAIVEDYLISARNGAAVAAAQGRPNGEPAAEALCRAHGTTTETAFRTAVAACAAAPLLDLLDTEDRKAITTWRGTLP
ncbi:tyrosine-protein phosphatase [Amycolatopsis jiangsuensis]|uniref:Protein tyrosine/serine phosphatase n=1 Tax=Amycolatopsis jiangsuensis TaxID=1181879 RepID=A0A840J031_9PSEU|nr:tyrosine-protein phosphatase [Amycolatopsis jiangsuensis]MBB4686524.1 hypothetical protein [Amycolatopsis jiangsuensis]